MGSGKHSFKYRAFVLLLRKTLCSQHKAKNLLAWQNKERRLAACCRSEFDRDSLSSTGVTLMLFQYSVVIVGAVVNESSACLGIVYNIWCIRP